MDRYIPNGTRVRISPTYYRHALRNKVGTVINHSGGNTRVRFSQNYYDWIDIKSRNLVSLLDLRNDISIEDIL